VDEVGARAELGERGGQAGRAVLLGFVEALTPAAAVQLRVVPGDLVSWLAASSPAEAPEAVVALEMGGSVEADEGTAACTELQGTYEIRRRHILRFHSPWPGYCPA
jgi:hypothetical protein